MPTIADPRRAMESGSGATAAGMKLEVNPVVVASMNIMPVAKLSASVSMTKMSDTDPGMIPRSNMPPEPDRIPRRAPVHRIWLYTARGRGHVSRGTGWSNIANVRREPRKIEFHNTADRERACCRVRELDDEIEAASRRADGGRASTPHDLVCIVSRAAACGWQGGGNLSQNRTSDRTKHVRGRPASRR
jgi:hypothetical protein